MRPAPWSDRHERLLEEAAPSVPDPSDAELERVWRRVAASMEGTRPPRGRRIRIGVAAGIGAVVLGTSGLAAAQLVTARTGEGPVDAEDLRLGGPGERLRMSAPDYGQVVDEETRDIPFPTAEARDLALQQQVDDARGSQSDEFVTTGALRAWVADQAMCAWSNEWAAATRDGDPAGRSEAIEVMRSAPAWPAVVALDPEPYRRMETSYVDDGEGNITTERSPDESHFFYLGALGEAVTGRDPGAVARVLAASNGYCRSELMPALPEADPMSSER